MQMPACPASFVRCPGRPWHPAPQVMLIAASLSAFHSIKAFPPHPCPFLADRPEGLVPALDVWMTSLAGKGSAPDAAWIEGRAALARALALRSHARAAAALEEGIAACCRPAAGVEDGPRFVRGVLVAAAQRSPSALVRPLWRQRTLTLLVSALLRALGPPPPFVPALCTLGAALTSVDPALQRSQLARVETLLAPCLAAVADLPGPEQTVTGLLDMLAGLAGSGATTGEGGMGWIGSFSL